MSRRHRTARRATQPGAALLVAMLILTLIATVASAMVWHQQRALEVEGGERARAQAALMLAGALDFVRLQLVGPSRNAFPPPGWVGRLPESSVAALLAADRQNNADSPLEAFVSGDITDAQSRYNLRRLVGDDGKVVDAEVAAFKRLCEAAGAPADLGAQLAGLLASAWFGRGDDAPLPPTRVEHLVWLGLDRDTLALLAPHVTLLPARTPLNANTASPPALLAAIDGLDLANAQRLVQTLSRTPAADVTALRALLPSGVTTDDARVGVSTRHFDVIGRLRVGDRMMEERWLIERRGGERGTDMALLRRERRAAHEGGP